MSKPFEGVKVVDLSGLPGAYGTRLLAGLGADVIKVEPPSGSQLRRYGPFAEGAPDGEGSLWWAFLAMGSRSVTLDPSDPGDGERLKELMASADVVVDDHGPGVLDAAGLGYDTIAAANPGVVWVSITPFGLHGPKRDWATSNLVAWASTGILYTVGFPERPPVVPAGPVQMAMHATALNAATGVMLALRVRNRTGTGQMIDLSIQESALALAPETGVPVFLDDKVHRERSGNRRLLSRPFGLYPCSDGYVSILVLMPHHWSAIATWIAEVTGNEAVLDPVFGDVAVRGETMELVDSWVEELTTQLTALEVFQEGQRRGIPITPVSTVAGLREDPHLNAAGFWTSTELPAGGEVASPGAPYRTNRGWWQLGRAPRLGEHNDEVLGS